MAARLQRTRRTFAAVLLLCGTGNLLRAAGAEPPAPASEAGVKAAYLYRLCSYVVWPPQDSGAAGPLTMATLAAPEVHEQLLRLVDKRTVDGRPIGLRMLHADESLDDVSVLFVGAAAQPSRSRWQQFAQTPGLLVVTDRPQGLALGGAINFFAEGGRIRFEAAPSAAERNGLKLSSRLLRVAERVVSP